MRNRALRLWADIGERATWTFVQTFLGQMGLAAASVDPFADISVLQRAGLAGLAASLAVLKGYAAARIGAKGTASTLPASLDTVVVG